MDGSPRFHKLLGLLCLFHATFVNSLGSTNCGQTSSTLFEHSRKTLPEFGGETVSFDKYKGNVVIVVNVASFWGLTQTTYTQLNALMLKYGPTARKSCSLQVLGFPCAQFANQEPGKDSEIMNTLKYVRPGKNFVPNFTMFSKLEVNGATADGLFSWLTVS